MSLCPCYEQLAVARKSGPQYTVYYFGPQYTVYYFGPRPFYYLRELQFATNLNPFVTYFRQKLDIQ